MWKLALAALVVIAACQKPAPFTDDAETASETTREDTPRLRAPVELLVILDTSESMTHAQLDLARGFLRLLIDALQPDDRFGLLVVSDDVETLVPPSNVSIEARADWLADVAAIESHGLSNLEMALQMAEELASEDTRIVLISDGWPSFVSRDAESFPNPLEREIYAIGVGRHNAPLLESLGRYYHLKDAADLANALSNELFDWQPVTTSGM